MDGSIDKGLRKKDDCAAIRPLAIKMPVGQGEKSITDVPMITAKRNLAIIIDVRDHSLGTDIQIQLTDVKKTELEAVFVILDGIIERRDVDPDLSDVNDPDDKSQ